MNFAFGLHIHVKFRFWKITFGAFDQILTVRFDPSTSRFATTLGGTEPASATSVFNADGVAITVWVA